MVAVLLVLFACDAPLQVEEVDFIEPVGSVTSCETLCLHLVPDSWSAEVVDEAVCFEECDVAQDCPRELQAYGRCELYAYSLHEYTSCSDELRALEEACGVDLVDRPDEETTP